jgi:hypothetical protein
VKSRLLSTNKIVTLVFTMVAILCSVEEVNAKDYLISRDSTELKVLSKGRLSLKRLDIINATDNTHLSEKEKKKLRKEVRAIKNDLYDLNGSRHIPFGAIAVLLLLPFAVYQTVKE